jgi:hypothetical protein
VPDAFVFIGRAERGRGKADGIMSRLMLAPAAVSLVLLIGCTSQPAAPSRVLGAPAAAVGAASATAASAAGGRHKSAGVIYVTGQQLYFDTIVVVDPLPMKGRFQPLGDSDGDGISETPFGPGDPGYLGGRWWVDLNHNGQQDAGDHFFLCPLLGPGRPTP